LWFADQLNDGICVTTAGAHTGAASTAGSEPAGNLTLTITDNHATTTPGGDDVCAVVNGCR
jgi:hypothetical protein